VLGKADSKFSGRDAPALLDLMVWLGLSWYAHRIDDAEPSLQLIRQEGEAAAREAGIDHLDWPAQRAALARAWELSLCSRPPRSF
jgi:hypothetical protein